MKKGTKDKVVAGIGTVWFLSLISTNANPKLWQVAMIGIALYEVIQIAVRIARREARRQRRRRYITVTRSDMKRVEAVVFNPYKEVRA